MRLSDHDNTSRDYKRARSLRNDPSPFERKLWIRLREQAKLQGLKFRRQQPTHPFIADFACMEAKLLVELDGGSHDNRLNYDKTRDEKLKERGYTVIRFTNREVAENLEYVLNSVLTAAARLIHDKPTKTLRCSPLPNPPRKGEGTPPLMTATGNE